MQPPTSERAEASGERRRITALFADVVGSTTLAEGQDPEDWTVLMNRVFAAMAETVERYDGTVSQFRGDEIVALFGAPRAHEDDPWRAVQAGLEMVAAVDQLARGIDTPIRIRVGINTGLTVVGEVGGGNHSEYTAMGDAMNVAARVQAAASPGSVMITADTLRLVGTDFEVRDAGKAELKGKSEAVQIYEVLGARGTSTRGRGVPGLRSPMVGRERELDELEGLLAAAEAGRGRVALILGEPGIGKSRLVREALGRVADRGHLSWAVGRCLSHGTNLPYHLVTSLVRALVGATEGDDQATTIAALNQRISELLGEGHPSSQHLAELVGQLPSGSDAGDPARRQAYLTAVASLIEAHAADRPLVLVAEDIHWADPSSSDQLAELLPLCHDMRVLLVLTSRADRTVPGWGVVQAAREVLGDALTEMALRPLDDEESRRLVGHLLSIESLPEELRGKILDKAEGNPFFVEEVVRMLIEQNAIERIGDRWRARAGIEKLEVPDTVEALIAARVDRLPKEARRTARIASVLGRRFPVTVLDELDAVAGPGDGSSNTQLGVLESHGLVRLAATRPQLEYAFRHALVQEVVYSSLLKSERRDLHTVIGELLERRNHDRSGEAAAELARHFEAADDDRAIAYLIAAGKWALGRFAVREAYDFFGRALARLVGDDPATRRLRVEAALGRYRAGLTFVPAGEEQATLQRALPDAEALADPALLASLHIGIAKALQYQGEMYESSEAMRTSLDSAFEYASQAQDPALMAVPASMMAEVRMGYGDYKGALQLWHETVPELERQGLLVEATVGAGLAARTHAVIGEFPEADHWLALSSDFGERSGDPNAKLDADLYRGWVEQERGNLDEANACMRRAIEAADEVGNFACSLVGNLIAGDQQLRMGEPEAAISYLKRGDELGAYCEVGNDLLALGQAWQAAARARMGIHAPDEFDQALDRARHAGNPLSEGEVLHQRANARLALPDPDWDGALSDLAEAVRRFEEIGARTYLARALNDLGAALSLAGRSDEASATSQRAAELFQEIGVVVPTR